VSAVEYDVLVKLHVDRRGGKALGDAAKPLQKGIRDADRAARAAANQRMREQRDLERRAIGDARGRIQAKRAQLAEQKKIAALESKAWRDFGGKAKSAGGMAKSLGEGMSNIGMGPLIGWAAKAGAIVGGILAGAITVALGKATLGGIGDNISGEQQKGSIGTTLQLYDFNTTDAKGNKRTDGEQFAENLENARWYQAELTRIADASPGDVNQVSELFTGMLPGMASITQDADRIVDLTQKATLLSAVLDNDFKSVGAQSSRILTGGAGAEMETWNRLQKPIRQAGIELGVFNKNQALGTKLTEKFNKLDPETRLKLFEEGLKRLGKPVADYFENSFEGITSQAKSSLLVLRKELGRGGFEAIKSRTKEMNKGGILDRSTSEFKKLFNFASYLGEQTGKGIAAGMTIAENAAKYVANNWEKIVDKAIYAGQMLADGARTAAELLAVRTGVGMGMKAGGAAIGAVSGIAQTAASVMALGPAALVAAPAIIGMGIVFGGLSLILGGAVAYVVTNLDTLAKTFEEWKTTAGPVIDAFWLAVEDVGTKFVALGEYFIGPADETSTFTTIVEGATSIVYGMTEAFSWLLGATADVIEGFGTMMDNLAVFIGGITGNGPDYVKLNMLQMGLEQATQGGFIGQEKDAIGGYWDSPLANEYRDRIAEEEAKGVPQYGVTGKQWADKIRAGKLRFDLAGNNGKSLEELKYKREQDRLAATPIGPVKPTATSATNPKPPKVNVKVTNHNHFNIRDTDPNAVVAAFNKNQGKNLALPLASALAQARRGS
jgi:hypothetical protein